MAEGLTPEQAKKLDEMWKASQSGTGRMFATSGSGADATTLVGGLIKDVVGVAKEGVGAIAALAEKSMSNTADAGDAVKAVSGILKSLGEPGRLAGGALDMLGNVLTDTLGNWQKFSNEGLNFAGNSLQFRLAVMRTGMSFDEFGESLDKIKPALFQLGVGIAGGLEAFGLIAQRLNDPQMQVALNTMGILPKEANEILAMTIRLGRANLDMNDEQGKKQLLESTLSLAREMDMMAKLTGISRKEQQKNIETIENDARVRARLSGLMNDPTKREGIGNVIAAGGVLPPEARKALAETIAGAGIMTSEKLSDLNLTYGARVANMYMQIGRLSNGTAADQKEAARLTRELVPAMVEGRRQQREFVAMGASTSGMAMEAYDINGAASNYENTLSKLMRSKEEGGRGMSQPGAEAELRARAKAQSEGMLIEDIKIMVKENGKLVEQTIKAEKDRNGNYITSDPTKIVTQLATTAKSIMSATGLQINEGVAKYGDKILEYEMVNGERVLSEASKKMIEAANGSADENGKAANIGKVFGQEINSFLSNNTTALTDLPKNMASAFMDLYGSLTGTKVERKPTEKERALGSKGATGSWWEGGPQSILMGEAGESESVVPFSQRGAFIRDNIGSIGGSAMSSILRNIPAVVSSGAKNVEQAVAEMASVMPDSNLLAEKLEKISTIMASVERNMAESTGHARETAKNTREIGGIVA